MDSGFARFRNVNIGRPTFPLALFVETKREMKNVRISAKAIIISNDKLFAMHHRGSDGEYYILPGGGQRNGESLISAVKRECVEEAGIKVVVGDVMYIREYIGDNHEFAGQKPGFHQVEIMFKCEILDESEIGKGKRMDERQIGVSWLHWMNLTSAVFILQS